MSNHNIVEIVDMFLYKETKLYIMMLLQRDKISLNETQPTPMELLRNLNNQINYINAKLTNLERKLDQPYGYQPEQSTLVEMPEIPDYSKEISLIQKKLNELEKKIDERMPGKVVLESTFKQESQDVEELVEKIVAKIQPAIEKPLVLNTGLTPVESKRIEKIIQILDRHEKLSSVELGDLTGLSRTRCNEYFKLMEKSGIVEAVSNGKEKYYVLRK